MVQVWPSRPAAIPGPFSDEQAAFRRHGRIQIDRRRQLESVIRGFARRIDPPARLTLLPAGMIRFSAVSKVLLDGFRFEEFIAVVDSFPVWGLTIEVLRAKFGMHGKSHHQADEHGEVGRR